MEYCNFFTCDDRTEDFSDAETSQEAIEEFLAVHEENKRKRLEKKAASG